LFRAVSRDIINSQLFVPHLCPKVQSGAQIGKEQMAKVRLTDKYVQSVKAKPGERLEVFDQDVRGLILRVTPAGRKSWVFRYRTPDGVQRRHALGIYLDGAAGNMEADEDDSKLKVLNLAQARAAARSIINDVGRGRDPSIQRELKIAAEKAQPLKTLEDLKVAYFQAVETGEWRPRDKVKRATTINEDKRLWDKYVVPTLAHLPIEQVTPAGIKSLLRSIVAEGKGPTSNRLRAVISQVYSFGVAEERIAVNPVSKIKKLAEEKPRTRKLTDAEMSAVWAALTDPTGLVKPSDKPGVAPAPVFVSEPIRIALKLLALTLARRSEVAGMDLSELELDRADAGWIVPGERTKNGKAHFVPLPPTAVALIRRALNIRLTDDSRPNLIHVFPSPRKKEDVPITPRALSHALRDIRLALDLPRLSPHDLRRTAASHMASERLRIPPFIISRLLNHSGEHAGAAAVTMEVYALYEFASEKRSALTAWENLLLEVVGERKPQENIVALNGV